MFTITDNKNCNFPNSSLRTAHFRRLGLIRTFLLLCYLYVVIVFYVVLLLIVCLFPGLIQTFQGRTCGKASIGGVWQLAASLDKQPQSLSCYIILYQIIAYRCMLYYIMLYYITSIGYSIQAMRAYWSRTT